jgi:ABC-type molybdate transport system permease subunit
MMAVFENQIYLDGIINSIKIAIITTLIAFLIAFPLALIFDKYNFSGKKWTSFTVMLPMILPPFAHRKGKIIPAASKAAPISNVSNQCHNRFIFMPPDFLPE